MEQVFSATSRQRARKCVLCFCRSRRTIFGQGEFSVSREFCLSRLADAQPLLTSVAGRRQSLIDQTITLTAGSH